jgi:septal ring factor EnvC (AmiA/AmiB activator)
MKISKDVVIVLCSIIAIAVACSVIAIMSGSNAATTVSLMSSIGSLAAACVAVWQASIAKNQAEAGQAQGVEQAKGMRQQIDHRRTEIEALQHQAKAMEDQVKAIKDQTQTAERQGAERLEKMQQELDQLEKLADIAKLQANLMKELICNNQTQAGAHVKTLEKQVEQMEKQVEQSKRQAGALESSTQASISRQQEQDEDHKRKQRKKALGEFEKWCGQVDGRVRKMFARWKEGHNKETLQDDRAKLVDVELSLKDIITQVDMHFDGEVAERFRSGCDEAWRKLESLYDEALSSGGLLKRSWGSIKEYFDLGLDEKQTAIQGIIQEHKERLGDLQGLLRDNS